MTALHLDLLTLFYIPQSVYTLFGLTLFNVLTDLALNGLYREDEDGAYIITPAGYDTLAVYSRLGLPVETSREGQYSAILETTAPLPVLEDY